MITAGTGTIHIADADTATVTLDSIPAITEGQSTTVQARLHIFRNNVQNATDTLAAPVTVHLAGNSHNSSSTATYAAGAHDGDLVTLTITSSDDLDFEGDTAYLDNFVVTGVATAGGSPASVQINDNDANRPSAQSVSGGSYALKLVGGNINIYQGANPTPLTSEPFSDSYSLTINGTGGNDDLTVDLTGNADTIPNIAGGLTFNGGSQAGTPGDALHIVGGSQGNVTYSYTSGLSGSGAITMSAFGTVNYTGLEPITNSGSAIDVELDLPAGSDNATLGDDGSGNFLLSSSPATFENTTFTAPTHSLKVVGDSGDILTVNKAVTVSDPGSFIALNVPTVNLNANLTAATVSGNALTVNVDDNPSGQIQDGIDVAASGATVNVAAGNYVDNLKINKPLHLIGAGQASVKVVPAFEGVVSSNQGSSLPSGASNMVLVQSSNVEISGLTLNGDNPAILTGTNVGGANIDARNGIIEDFNAPGTPFNNTNVHDVTVKNIYLRGIYASSGGSGFVFNNNTVDNVQGSDQSIAIFNFGGSGQITNNHVSNAADAISANHSRGTTFTGNFVTNSGSGIHTDNANDGAPSTPDEIAHNNISLGTPGAYGIFVFVPYGAVSVHDNTISDVDVGLAAFGSGFPPGPGSASFTNNSVTVNSGGTGAQSPPINWDSVRATSPPRSPAAVLAAGP